MPRPFELPLGSSKPLTLFAQLQTTRRLLNPMGHIQVFSGHVVSSSRRDAPWHHLSIFFLASSFPPFMVELFGVRFCPLPSQVFAGTSEPVRSRDKLSPVNPSPREPTLTEDVFTTSPEPRRWIFTKSDETTLAVQTLNSSRHVSVALTLPTLHIEIA